MLYLYFGVLRFAYSSVCCVICSCICYIIIYLSEQSELSVSHFIPSFDCGQKPLLVWLGILQLGQICGYRKICRFCSAFAVFKIMQDLYASIFGKPQPYLSVNSGCSRYLVDEKEPVFTGGRRYLNAGCKRYDSERLSSQSIEKTPSNLQRKLIYHQQFSFVKLTKRSQASMKTTVNQRKLFCLEHRQNTIVLEFKMARITS